MERKKYVCGWNACLVIIKIVVLMASSFILFLLSSAFHRLVVLTIFYNQLSARFSERPRYFSGELIPNRLFRVLGEIV